MNYFWYWLKGDSLGSAPEILCGSRDLSWVWRMLVKCFSLCIISAVLQLASAFIVLYYFSCALGPYSVMLCIYSCLYTQGSLLAELQRTNGVPGAKSQLIVCKATSLLAVLLLLTHYLLQMFSSTLFEVYLRYSPFHHVLFFSQNYYYLKIDLDYSCINFLDYSLSSTFRISSDFHLF